MKTSHFEYYVLTLEIRFLPILQCLFLLIALDFSCVLSEFSKLFLYRYSSTLYIVCESCLSCQLMCWLTFPWVHEPKEKPFSLSLHSVLDIPSKLSQAIYNSALAFTSCLRQAEKSIVGESLGSYLCICPVLSMFKAF